jgi:AraC family transcriptional regulator
MLAPLEKSRKIITPIFAPKITFRIKMEQRFSTKEVYLKRVNIVIEYINNHLDKDIDLEKLAEISNFSKWHFQRMMKAHLGEPIGMYIMRVRVETAAKLLRYSDMTISDIAYQVGYDVPSSLSKAFRLFYDISPNEYRNNKNYTIMKSLQLNENLNLKAPKMLTLEAKQVIYLKLTGDLPNAGFSRRMEQTVAVCKRQQTFFCRY